MGKKRKGTPPVLCNWLFIIVLITTFFCCGVFLGTKVVHSNPSEPQPRTVGLPGTNNLLKKWEETSSSGPMVKGMAAATSNRNLRGGGVYSTAVTAISPSPPLPSPPSPLTAMTQGSILQQSLHATGKSFMVIPQGNKLDHADILIGAYIYLDEAKADDSNMRPIFANKNPGCEKSEEQYGFALTVNGWQDPDHRLHLEYGGEESGCFKLDSRDVKLDTKKWYHIAVYAGQQFIALYIDGVVVDSVAESVSDREFHRHMPNTKSPWTVGDYGNGEYRFFGNISHLAVVHDIAPTALTDINPVLDRMRTIDQDARTILGISQLVGLWPLIDGVQEKGEGLSVDVKGGHNGVYTFPVFGSSMSGVNIKLIDGTNGRFVTDAMRKESDVLGYERREAVKQGMLHAWAGYKRYAWGKDELKPQSQRGTDNWGGMGVTLVDSLDTLWVMGLKKEFNEAKEWVEKSLTFSHAGSVSVFETTIRELGGLLSAFDLSGEQVFLTKAQELGDLLFPAFSTKTGIPTGQVNIRNGARSGGWQGSSAVLSELGSLQVENRYLSFHTGERKYETAAMVPFQLMHRLKPPHGLFPIKIGIDSGHFADSQVTFGALGDSFYEYLLKVWLQGNRQEDWLREMYDNAVDGMLDKLLAASHGTGLAFLADWNIGSNRQHRKMDHLVCFMPGVLALGAYTDPQGLQSSRAQRDLAVAKALTYTCREMYHRQKTGIAPEYVEFPERGDMVPGASAQFYILRPETAESLFILGQLTGDPIYREWAWEIWQAIDSHCKCKNGYGAIPDVNTNGRVEDRMESFFLAETMKYLYLAQDPDMPIDLMKYVFNTEAHPTRILEGHEPVAG